MTAHQLARHLLAGPDLPVMIETLTRVEPAGDVGTGLFGRNEQERRVVYISGERAVYPPTPSGDAT
jgi:hypothetical protein